MDKYESIIIIKPNENKEEINRTLDKFKKQIESFSNKNVNMEKIKALQKQKIKKKILKYPKVKKINF